MLQSLVPVLLLVTVALSSTNVLPFVSVNQLDTEPAFDGQPHDNILSNNRLKTNILNNIFYKLTKDNNKIDYLDPDNNIPEYFEDTPTKDDNYDGKGFRKEQWHNYPRQLDRLNLYDPGKTTPDYDDPGNEDIQNMESEIEEETLVNEIPNSRKVTKDLVSILAKPLLVFKIHLGNLVNETVDEDFYKYVKTNQQEDYNGKSLQRFQNSLNQIPQKREELGSLQKTSPGPHDQKKTVKKRLFSLWSRLQSLSHKGHGLQHRRHIYALYNQLQDNPSSGGGGGVLTAETRAFIRPPGSPLRWG